MNNKPAKERVIGRILDYAKSYVFFLIGALVCATVSVTTSLLIPVLIGGGIDNIVGVDNVNFANLLPILIQLGITVVVSAITQWMMTYCTNQLTYQTVKNMRKDVFAKINQLPLKYIDGHSHGDLIAIVVTDLEQISDGLLQGFAKLFTGVVTIIGTIGFMLVLNTKITLLVIALTPVSLIVSALIAQGSYKMFREQSAVRGEMTGLIEEMVGNQKTIKAFHHEDEAFENFAQTNQRLYECGWRAQYYSAIGNPTTRFINNVVYAAIGIVGAIAVIQGTMSIGQLSSFLSYANQYTKPFNEISGVVTELQSAFSSAKRVFHLLDQENEVEDVKSSVAVEFDGTVELEHVKFSYEPDKPLIKDFTIQAKRGQKIAFVGPTGCGKTTIINLLMRFYDIDSGEIRVNNENAYAMSRSELRSNFGMVLQDSWLFTGTIMENIAYSKPDATKEEVIAAAKAAHIHGFIRRLPKGYDTMISEDGENVSQGQKQLLCIARIMLMKPPMLILDEATSNIDTRTEQKIQEAFNQMMVGRTSFIIAHRLSTIKEADTILVLKDGNIIERGTHEELLEQDGFYTNLYNSQFAGE